MVSGVGSCFQMLLRQARLCSAFLTSMMRLVVLDDQIGWRTIHHYLSTLFCC
jgi:hypothetical protein